MFLTVAGTGEATVLMIGGLALPCALIVISVNMKHVRFDSCSLCKILKSRPPEKPD